MSHTKGPWVRRGADTYRWQIETDGDARKATVIARITTPPKGGTEASDANAHLIAAAPDMLEALENLTIAIGMGWDLDGVLATAEAAIKKARGEK